MAKTRFQGLARTVWFFIRSTRNFEELFQSTRGKDPTAKIGFGRLDGHRQRIWPMMGFRRRGVPAGGRGHDDGPDYTRRIHSTSGVTWTTLGSI